MKRNRSKGFVANEPLLVLATFAAICFLAGWGLASLMNWPFGYGMITAVLAFAIGIGAFAAYVRLSRVFRG